MRNSQTLQIEFRIQHHPRAEISLEQVAILALENLQRKRVSTFLDRMNDLLEFGEHGLPKKCSANVIDLSIDDVGAHFWIRGLFEKMMSEQFFVKGRRDFGEKNWIIRILIELVALRVPGMHRVAGLVRQGVDVGEDVALVIHQNVGRRAVASAGEGA